MMSALKESVESLKEAADKLIEFSIGSAESPQLKSLELDLLKVIRSFGILSLRESVKEVEKETARPEPSGPKYGLLSNNAFKHVGTSQPPS